MQSHQVAATLRQKSFLPYFVREWNGEDGLGSNRVRPSLAVSLGGVGGVTKISGTARFRLVSVALGALSTGLPIEPLGALRLAFEFLCGEQA